MTDANPSAMSATASDQDSRDTYGTPGPSADAVRNTPSFAPEVRTGDMAEPGPHAPEPVLPRIAPRPIGTRPAATR